MASKKKEEPQPEAQLGMTSIPMIDASTLHDQVKQRMQELAPAVDEYYKLEQADKALSKIK